MKVLWVNSGMWREQPQLHTQERYGRVARSGQAKQREHSYSERQPVSPVT